jgi:hypothetical protein
MCTLTQRELEFLARLRTSWRKLYWRECARILAEDAIPARLGATHAAHFVTESTQDPRDWPISPRPH